MAKVGLALSKQNLLLNYAAEFFFTLIFLECTIIENNISRKSFNYTRYASIFCYVCCFMTNIYPISDQIFNTSFLSLGDLIASRFTSQVNVTTAKPIQSYRQILADASS